MGEVEVGEEPFLARSEAVEWDRVVTIVHWLVEILYADTSSLY